MTNAEANKIKDFIDSFVEGETPLLKPTAENEPIKTETVTKDKSKDKRVARTKTSGDKVYLLDEKTKEKRWISSDKVLKGLGFNFSDVEEISDSELSGYKLTQALYEHSI